jgi:hypothetical protein
MGLFVTLTISFSLLLVGQSSVVKLNTDLNRGGQSMDSSQARAKSTNWQISQISSSYYGNARHHDPKIIVLPSYQRRFVWGLKKRANLIDSVLKGWPIGALIVRKTGELKPILGIDGKLVDVETYEVIDGQQRSTTLLLHSLFPLEIAGQGKTSEGGGDRLSTLLNVAGIDFEEIRERYQDVLGLPVSENWFETQLREWARTKTFTFKTFLGAGDMKSQYRVKILDREKLSAWELKSFLINNPRDSNVMSKVFQGYELEIEKLVSQLSDLFLVDKYEIPIIEWPGQRSDAPAVFVRVNQGGEKLNKYQVLAAAFAHVITDVEDGDIWEHAKQILSPKPGSTLIELQDDSGDNRLDLYSALIGLSSVLTTSYPRFFKPLESVVITPEDSGRDDDPKERDPEESKVKTTVGETKITEPYDAFNIVTLIFGLTLSMDSMSSLGERITEEIGVDKGGAIRFRQVVNAVLQGMNLVSDSLDFIRYSTRKDGKYDSAHGELTFAPLVARASLLFLKDSSDLEIRKFKDAVRCHYLFDNLGGFNSGEGHGLDQIAFDRVWRRDTESREIKVNNHYLERVSKAEVEEILEQFWVSDLAGAKKDGTPGNRSAPTTRQRMLLKYEAAAHVPITFFSPGNLFDVDHSVPFAKLRTWQLVKNEEEVANGGEEVTRIPYKSIANLGILPKRVNAKKGNRTLDELANSDKTDDRDLAKEGFAHVSYIPGQLLVDGNDVSTHPKQFVEQLEERWKTMKQNILKTAKVS